MWVMKLKINSKNTLLGTTAKMFSVSLSGYPIRSHENNEEIFVDFLAFIFGTPENEKKFIEKLKHHPRVVAVEKEANFMMGRLREKKKHSSVYNSNIIHIEPVVINDKGEEYWTLGSWEKESLMEFIESVEKGEDIEVLSVKQKPITNFTMLNVFPNLSPQQKLVMDLAIKEGYYTYPRRTTIDKMADILKISYSTLQAHLRKAENKFLPYCFKQFYK